MWAKAEEISPEDHDGPVYDDSRDKYFENYDEAIDYFDSEDVDSIPEYLMPCKEHPCPTLDLDQVLENLVDDLFEDAIDHLKGVADLQTAVDVFNKRQTLKSWSTDRSRKLRVKMPEVTLEQS